VHFWPSGWVRVGGGGVSGDTELSWQDTSMQPIEKKNCTPGKQHTPAHSKRASKQAKGRTHSIAVAALGGLVGGAEGVAVHSALNAALGIVLRHDGLSGDAAVPASAARHQATTCRGKVGGRGAEWSERIRGWPGPTWACSICMQGGVGTLSPRSGVTPTHNALCPCEPPGSLHRPGPAHTRGPAPGAQHPPPGTSPRFSPGRWRGIARVADTMRAAKSTARALEAAIVGLCERGTG